MQQMVLLMVLQLVLSREQKHTLMQKMMVVMVLQVVIPCSVATPCSTLHFSRPSPAGKWSVRLAGRAAIAHSIIGGSPCAMDEGGHTLASSLLNLARLCAPLPYPKDTSLIHHCNVAFEHSHGMDRGRDLSPAGCHVHL